MSGEQNFRGKRMREAMQQAGLTSGQVAYRMGVSDGTVRGWTTGRRGIGPDELAVFATVVDYPVEYFLYPDYRLPGAFSIRHEVTRLADEVRKLVEKVAEQEGWEFTTDEQAIRYLQRAHGLRKHDVDTIRRMIEQADAGRGQSITGRPAE